MPENAQMERGHLYPAQKPSYNAGQTGKGATVTGDHQNNPGTVLPIGNDPYAASLKKTWSQSTNGKSFASFAKSL